MKNVDSKKCYVNVKIKIKIKILHHKMNNFIVRCIENSPIYIYIYMFFFHI